RIAPLSSVAANTIVNNLADIYFDYNAPVTTNKVSNKYVTKLPGIITSVEPSMQSTLSVFPNPTDGAFTIKVADRSDFQYFEIRSVLGNRVERFPIHGHELVLQGYSPGLYIVTLVGKASTRHVKVMVKD
ncbi:MAG: T9SS type A sorting domain-containing protein, partial [Bacteroidota bacterium]